MSRLAVTRRAFSAIAIGLLATLCAGSRAAGNSVDYTDTWWNPAESGWGMQVIQQVDVLFATIYVYDRQSSPDWYSASLSANAAGAWSGDLYATHGPWFGGSFSAGPVTKQKVGELSVSFSTSNRGTLVYSIDGVPVTRTIERMTMRNANVSGMYMFSMNAAMGRCGSSPPGSSPLAALATFAHVGGSLNAQIDIIAVDGTLTCNFTGSYVQSGKLARSDGTYTCAEGAYGTYSITDVETASGHMCGDLAMRNNANGCTLTSTFASVRF